MERRAMNTTPYFTKVRQKPRPPLTQTLERFLENVEAVVVADVHFALTGEETPTDSGPIQTQEENEIK
jgi:type III secretory pathway lipoprotein EscJ